MIILDVTYHHSNDHGPWIPNDSLDPDILIIILFCLLVMCVYASVYMFFLACYDVVSYIEFS